MTSTRKVPVIRACLTVFVCITTFCIVAEAQVRESRQLASLKGVWQLSIPALHRKPRLELTQTGDNFAGTWHGMAGDFPVEGKFDKDGTFNFTVDFDSAPLAVKKKLAKGKAIASFAGTLKGETISGVASFPQMDERQVDWSGQRDQLN
jgi:hypothetical protein